MAVSSRSLHQPSQRRVLGHVGGQARIERLAPFARSGLWILMAVLSLSVVTGQGRIWLDDLQYGRPRTQHLSGMVGHNEAAGEPTHFVAMNLNRRVIVVELPGGDVAKAQTLQGPYLFGVEEHLTPVTLKLHDMNGDAKNDLILAVKQEEIIYINTGESFRLISAEERQQLSKAP